ncbi:MAG: hypothetical protein IH577_04490 [Deltaproteobacteria bacterium]|nr:hypothetical protein [Deltaproteobacteria bacterium]
MIDTFCINGRVGDIGIKDKTIEVKLVFPNDQQTEEELSYIYPIKRGGLATIRIFAAVNKGYNPGRRRPTTDETGTPLLPGFSNNEICHGCGKTIDTVNQPFYVAKEGDKEKFLCDVCYMVPQPETIEPPAAADGEKAGDPDTAKCSDCINFKPPEGEAEEGVCTVHAGDPLEAYRRPEAIACCKFSARPLSIDELRADVAAGEAEPGPEMTPEEAAQLQPGDVADLGAAPEPKACAACGHLYPLVFTKIVKGGKEKKIPWQIGLENQTCPACGAENSFPDEEEGGSRGRGVTKQYLTPYQAKLLRAISNRPEGMKLAPDEVRAVNELERKGLVVIQDMVAHVTDEGKAIP